MFLFFLSFIIIYNNNIKKYNQKNIIIIISRKKLVMEYLYFIKNNSLIEKEQEQKEYYFVEVLPKEEGLVYTNPYNKEIKDEYIYYDYSLVLSEPFFMNEEKEEKEEKNKKIENQEKLLDVNKYYVCCKNNQYGFRKPYQNFISIIMDEESSRDIKTKLNFDIRCKLMDLMLKEKMLNLTQ